MIVRAVSAVAVVLILAGCATSRADPNAKRLKAGLAGVETQCGATPGTLKLGSDNLVAVIPSPEAKYETIECVFHELKKPEFADHIKLGFVGNEQAGQEEEH